MGSILERLRRRRSAPPGAAFRVPSIGAKVRPVPGSTTEHGLRQLRESADRAYAQIGRRR